MNLQEVFTANRNSTARMKQMAERLSTTQLTSVLPNGWTVSVTLAHLAFWDQRVTHLIEMAKKEGKVIRTEIDVQINDIIEPFLNAIPPYEAVRLAANNADALDQMLEDCSSEMLEQLEQESPRWVDRSLHRNEHLDDIETYFKMA